MVVSFFYTNDINRTRFTLLSRCSLMEDFQTKKKISRELQKTYPDGYLGLDFSFQGIKCLSTSVFNLLFLRELNFRGNDLEVIPPNIYLLKNLEVLNFSKNKIKHLPKSLGKMVNLKELILSDNFISNVPMEIGTLYNLKVLELSNNPLISPFNILHKDKKLLQYCREHNSNYKQPADRTWIDTVIRKNFEDTGYCIGTYNTLSNYQASKLEYPPTWILNPEYRKENVLHSICSFDLDILCLQEIETCDYNDFFKEQLEMRCDYDGCFKPRGRYKVLSDLKHVDGCATFWKKTKFKMLDCFEIDFAEKFYKNPKFANKAYLYERYGTKDNIALVTILKSIAENCLLIVVNVHLYWDPEFSDIKLVQTIILIEELNKLQKKYENVPIILLGDFNSMNDSLVYKYLIGSTAIEEDLDFDINDIRHDIEFKDAYCNEENDFTNFTPTFKGVIDHIFYTPNIDLVSVLSGIESEYSERVVGLPNIHFPSDHILIACKFQF